MAHYTILDENNIVVLFFEGRDENDGVDWEEHYGNIHNKVCKRTSVNTSCGVHWTCPIKSFPSEDQSKSFRYNVGSVGTEYDPVNDAFIMTKPTILENFGSYVYKTDIFSWVLESNGTLPQPNWVINSITGLPQVPHPYPLDGKAYQWDDPSVAWVEYDPDNTDFVTPG